MNGVTATTTGTQMMVGPANTPTAAITTVGTTAFDGVAALNLFTLCVQGSVLSYTTIGGILAAGTNSSGSPTACPDSPSPSVTVKAAGSPLLAPLLGSIPTGCGLLTNLYLTPCTPLGTSLPPVPSVPDPSSVSAPANNPQPVCSPVSGGKVYAAAFLPGRYTTATSSKSWSLSTPCASGSKWIAPSVDWFSPGVYYFDFGPTTWTLPAALVGGTPATASGQPIAGLNPATPSTLSNLSQMPTGEGKCIPPAAQTRANESGVEFVFGGASTMTGMTADSSAPSAARAPTWISVRPTARQARRSPSTEYQHPLNRRRHS